jgi:hypothetical protein
MIRRSAANRAAGRAARETPGRCSPRGQLLAEEGVCVGHGLAERGRQRSLERRAVVRPADAAQPGVDGPGHVACVVTLERGLDHGPDHLQLDGARCRRPRRVKQGKGLDRVRGVQCQLQRHAGARGMADDVRALDPELAHQLQTLRGLRRNADCTRHSVAPPVSDAVVAQQGMAVGQRAWPAPRGPLARLSTIPAPCCGSRHRRCCRRGRGHRPRSSRGGRRAARRARRRPYSRRRRRPGGRPPRSRCA